MSENSFGKLSEIAQRQAEDDRLTGEEALLYQEYASKLNAKGFSELADETSYQEAEQLINKLRDQRFDWLNIDWDTIDLTNLNSINTLEERLSTIVHKLAEQGDLQGNPAASPGALKKILGRIPGLIPLALSISMLTGCTIVDGAISKALVAIGDYGQGHSKEKQLADYSKPEPDYSKFKGIAEKTEKKDQPTPEN